MRRYLFHIVFVLFFGVAYLYVFGVGMHLSVQPPSLKILGANLVVVAVSLLLLGYLQAVHRGLDSRHRAFLFGILFLYNFGLLMQYANAQNMPPRMSDLAVLRSSDQWIADSLYQKVAQGDYERFADQSVQDVRRLSRQGDRDATLFLIYWSGQVNQALEQSYAEDRASYILAQTYQRKHVGDASRIQQANVVLEQREANVFDRLPVQRTFGHLTIRLLPVLVLWLLFALFGFGIPQHFRLVGWALALLLLGATFSFHAMQGVWVSMYVLGLIGLVVAFGVAAYPDDDLGERIWYHLFEGVWRKVNAATIYLSFAAAATLGLLCWLAVAGSDTGAAEILKLPLAFILMWMLYFLHVQSSISHDLVTRTRHTFRESALFYPTTFLSLSLLLFSPVGLTAALDVGQSVVISFAVVLLLLFARHDVRHGQVVGFLTLGVIVAMYFYLTNADTWTAYLRPFTHDVLWVLCFLVALGILIFWATPHYRQRRMREAYVRPEETEDGLPYTPWTTYTQLGFVLSMVMGVVLISLRVASTKIAEHPTARYRLTLFEDLFSPELIHLRGTYTSTWWDAAHNMVESLFGMLDAGLVGATLGRGGAEHVTKISQDFMFSAVVGDWGAIGGVCLLLIVGYLAVQGYQMAGEVPQIKQRFFVLAVIAFLVAQTLVTVLGSMGGLPLTGVPIPLVSDGLTSATTYAVLLGLVAVLHQRYVWVQAHTHPAAPATAHRPVYGHPF